MYKLFNRVSSKERESPSTAPSTFEEKFKLFNRGSSVKMTQEREPSFHGGSAPSPVEETKFRLFGRGSSKSAQEREPTFHASPPAVIEERFKLFHRGSAGSRLAHHDKDPPAAHQQVNDEKPLKTPVPLSEEPEQPQILLPCPTCFRTFRVESLDRHKSVCEKVATKKRKVFDSAKQRLEDLPEVVVAAVATTPTRTPLSPTLKRPSSTSPVKKQQSAWKENHLSLIRTVREARASDMSRCPYCERNFNNKAYDRHVEWCKEQQSRMPKSPTCDNNEAKERWEARTKYRAPPLRRSIRSKYSPTRSLFSATASPAASVDRLPIECTATRSLSGSRASLDSRASSSAMSYQPMSTYSHSAKSNGQTGSNYLGYSGSATLGRAAGNQFVRQSSERRSLRAAPASPPPMRRSAEPPVPLTPINNNRTSALRASLRMKNAFSNLNSPYQAPHQPAVKTPIVSRYAQQNLTTPGPTPKRPSVLQLFSSAFNRQQQATGTSAASVPSSPQPARSSRARVAAPAPSLVPTSHGRRSEPEGVESKLMTASCYGNYSSPPSASTSMSKLKPPTRSAPILGKFRVKSLVVGTSLLPNKVCPMSNNNNNNNRSRSRINQHYLKRYSASDSYNPYLSAEKQMAELFNDDYTSKEKNRFSFSSPKDHEPPLAPETPTPDKEDNTNMEQLERDLKSILSEINQLGKEKEKEVTKGPAPLPPLRFQQPPNSNKVSTLSFTMSVPRTPSTPTSPMSPSVSTKASTPDTEDRQLPKFCHSCGSAYPDRYEVKFCCQCGARRLYI